MAAFQCFRAASLVQGALPNPVRFADVSSGNDLMTAWAGGYGRRAGRTSGHRSCPSISTDERGGALQHAVRPAEGRRNTRDDRRHHERRQYPIAPAIPAETMTPADHLRYELANALRPFPDYETFSEDGSTED